MSCPQSSLELNNVVVISDDAGNENAARAVYHIVKSYKNNLIYVKKFEVYPLYEKGYNLVKDIDQYIK